MSGFLLSFVVTFLATGGAVYVLGGVMYRRGKRDGARLVLQPSGVGISQPMPVGRVEHVWCLLGERGDENGLVYLVIGDERSHVMSPVLDLGPEPAVPPPTAFPDERVAEEWPSVAWRRFRLDGEPTPTPPGNYL